MFWWPKRALFNFFVLFEKFTMITTIVEKNISIWESFFKTVAKQNTKGFHFFS